MKHNQQPGQINIGFREYSIRCGVEGCFQEFVDFFDTKKQFISSARGSGWRIRDGSWCCPSMHPSTSQSAPLAKHPAEREATNEQ